MSTADKPKAVPLLVLGSSRRRMLHERLTAIVMSWYKAWASEGVTQPTVTLATDPMSREPRGGTVTLLALHEGMPVIYALGTADVARLLVGVGTADGALAALISPADGLSLSLAEGVVRGLCSEILQAAFPDSACALERQRAHGVGGPGAPVRDRNTPVIVSFGKARPAVELALAPELVDALLGPRPRVSSAERLTPRRQAGGEERVRVSAMLGTAVVSWRDLTALAAGNVLVLDQTLDSSCVLLVSGKDKLGDAQVGVVDGSLAVQITSVTPRVAGSHSI